jgi:N-acetylneuraminic acid mutarotase
MVWTGSSAAVWGGAGKAGTNTNDGALYDPLAKVWTPLPSPPTVLTERRSGAAIAGFGNELYIWGGQGSTVLDGSIYRNDGAHLKTASSWAVSFAPLPSSVLASPKRALSATWFGAGRLFIWSGIGDVGGGVSGALPNGASYDPNFDTWAPMLTVDEPAKRIGATVVWTGKFAILFGGKAGTTLFADGGLYVP